MSTLKADTIQNTSGGAATLTKQEAAKARFVSDSAMNLVGAFNIASGTDNGTGNYTYAFTNAMANTSYCGPNCVQSGQDKLATIGSLTTSNFVIELFDASAGSNQDGSPHQCIFGDLA